MDKWALAALLMFLWPLTVCIGWYFADKNGDLFE